MSDHQFSASRDVEMSPALPEPTASSSTSDPASSLRAAALLTLKSKRRKAQPSLTPALPSRPPTDNAFHLDYGQEESPSVSRDISHTLIVDPPKPTATPEIQTREEGEISDEENPEPTLARPKPRSPASLPPPPDINFGNARHPTPSTSALSQQYSLHTKPTLSERISDVPNMSNSVSLTQGDISDHVQNDLAPAFQDPGGLIDVDHVRPGVALNKVQYDRAKDNVLDLLGWGVAPEYLVDCGLTREIVYYVFSELNLRLPQNLDTTGLIPYRSDTSLLAERQKSALMPPPPPPQARRYSIGHLNPSSQAPTQKATHSPSRSTSPPPLPGISSVQGILSTPASPQPAPTSTLHDMEQQRRQELLARKAVIASRKSKQGSAPAASSPFPGMPIPSSNRQDVEMSVPTETVDDFLKTIGPSSNVGDVSTASSSLHQQPETDMDVDEIPGLGGAKQFTTTPSIPSRGSSRPPPPADTPISPTQSAHTPMSPNMCPPSSTESTSTTFTDKSGSHTPSDTPTLQEGPALQRRGAKRPVAADFVDLDGGNRLSSNGNGGYATGMHSGSRRRTGAGFANIANARRFIIDLSDSEGEGDGDVVMRDMGHSESAGRRSLYGSPAPTRPTVPSLNTSNGWATPPITTATPILSGTSLVQNGIMSPAALMEKEIEIQKMRELIAQREQRRLTKMAAAKAIAETCASTESSSVTVKREEMAISISTDNGSNFQNRLGGPSESLPLNHWHIDSATGSASISGSPSSSAPASATPPIGSLFSRLLALPTSG
ncbi:hypothetical protein FPV67DRAFT_763391 [Lyophyllum atratum]|nr:hypothetical protein FPV67DRAFT_763391 [Lyophyllum atratum]